MKCDMVQRSCPEQPRPALACSVSLNPTVGLRNVVNSLRSPVPSNTVPALAQSCCRSSVIDCLHCAMGAPHTMQDTPNDIICKRRTTHYLLCLPHGIPSMVSNMSQLLTWLSAAPQVSSPQTQTTSQRILSWQTPPGSCQLDTTHRKATHAMRLPGPCVHQAAHDV